MISWDKYERYNEKGKKIKFFKKYPEKLQQLYEMKQNEKSNIEIARMFGLHHSTIRAQWKKHIRAVKSQDGCATITVRIIKSETCLVKDDEGVRNPGHNYREYLQIERDKRYKILLRKGGMKNA